MTNNIEALVGQIPIYIATNEEDYFTFYLTNGYKVKLYHEQDCCESVYLESLTGSPDKLLYTPLIKAEERSNSPEMVDSYTSQTWTFYTFASAKGYVDLRWHGESNGYYSESIDIDTESYEFVELPIDVQNTLKIKHPELCI